MDGVAIGDDIEEMKRVKGTVYETFDWGDDDAYSYYKAGTPEWVRYDVNRATKKVVRIFK